MGEKELRAGGIGLAFLSAVPILIDLGYRIAEAVFWESIANEPYIQYYLYLSTFRIAAFLIFLIFAVLFFITIKRDSSIFEGINIGKVGAAFGIITAVAHIMFSLSFVLGISLDGRQVFYAGEIFTELTPNIIGDILYLITLGLFVLTMIIIGVFFLINRRNFTHKALWIAAGVIFLIVGGLEFQWSFQWLVWGWDWSRLFYTRDLLIVIEEILFFVACVLGARSFFASRRIPKET